MVFSSILYEDGWDDDAAPRTAPDYFPDLNLDQIVDAITVAKEEYDLKPFFYVPLRTTDAIFYRHAVMHDLECDGVLECIVSFAESMRMMRKKLGQSSKLSYKYQKERWFLHAVETYCAAVLALRNDLARLTLTSRGLNAFRDYVGDYAESDSFLTLLADANELSADLAEVAYCIRLKDSSVKVRKCEAEQEYSAQVLETFDKFRQGAVKDYRATFSTPVEMNHIEAKILEFVALLYPETFSKLDHFAKRRRDFVEPVLRLFDREIQFYVAYLEHTNALKKAGLSFCYPRISTTDKRVRNAAGFDLALAAKLVAAGAAPVCNDLEMRGNERILVISGPNQGGKTTFARTFGQLHHLASIGCPVPGRDAQLFLFDSLFTHFEREEAIENLHGNLQSDLIRVHDILVSATPRSIVIINEIFNSTSLTDAVFLARQVMEQIIELDLLCVCVTFLDELASFSEKTVSMVSTVMPDNPAVRTYKVVRRPADGRSYAVLIAEKQGLTYERIKARIGS